MAIHTVMVNGKAVELEGISFQSISTTQLEGQNTGVSAFIRSTIEEAAKQKTAVKITTLAALLVTTFSVSEEEKKAGKKGLPEDQARVRINNVLRNSPGKYAKVYTNDGYVALTTVEALNAIKKERKEQPSSTEEK